jgi:cobalamin biosynthesis protein CobD/CbiB
MRTALPKNPSRAGWILALWLVGTAFVIGFGLTQTAWVLGEGAPGKFVVWVIGFFLLFGIRRRSAAGHDVMASLLANSPDLARQWLIHLDGDPGTGTPEDIAHAAVTRMSQSVVEKALLITFWGVTLGLGAAAAAAAVHELASHARRSEDPADPLWAAALRAERWVTMAPTWIGVILVYLVIPLAGGSRARSMAGFVNQTRRTPLDRLALAVEAGLGLTRTRALDGTIHDPIGPEDIRRSIIVLWTASFVGVGMMSGITALLFRFVGG